MHSISTGTVFQERYEILSKLGEGGFSQVYRARQRATGQEVAVKVLQHLHASDEGHIARFQREMQLCARLYHPHIVRLIDSGRTGEGLLYTVFEYVPGRTLGDVLAAEGALPPWEAAHLMLQVLDALGCAHKLGIIHRDLKPQNIMLTSTGVRRNSLVLDFGLGTLTDEGRREELSRITRTNEMLGTPAYSAPEQLRGEPVTARADLYAWGLIFLECLTGQRVVGGSSLQETVFMQLGAQPIVLPEWLVEHRLGRLLRRVLEKDARARDVSAQSLLLELESCVTQGWPSPEAVVPRLLGNSPHVLIDGERRQLTAVCCGLRLVGEGVDAVDAEDLDMLLWEQHTAAVDLSRRREAWLGSVLGERLLLYFGYPRAQEDDAQRAAQMALEVVAELEQRSAELARIRGIRLEVRIGIHTGLVISHELREHGLAGLPVLAGNTPTVAERLELLARPGEILVSPVTAKLLRDTFALESSGEHDVGSGTRPVPVFRLRARSRASVPGLEGTPAEPLLGRALELELLQQRWRQTVAGMGQAILISGEPGIGKSRLAQELARQGRGSHIFLECRCAPEWRNNALRPVVDLLERMLGMGRGWTAEQTTGALEVLLSRYGFDLAETLPLFASLLSLKEPSDRYPTLAMSPERQKEQTLYALLSLFFEMAQQQPVMLVVEDLHWADPTTLELLTLLVKDVASGPLCAVLTARPEFAPPWSSAQVLQIQLSRLERPHVEALVKRLSRNVPLPPEVVEKMVERADGVPLFIEELTRMVAESLPQQEDPLEQSATALEIPATLRDSLMARLDRLGPAKATAQLASALGREFTYEVLEASSVSDEEALKRHLDALVAADLVHRRRSARHPVYVFRHALIRDTAYESMLKPMRRQVHARIAVALELRFPELVRQRPDLLARHHAAAEQKREALSYALKAATAALMRSAHHEALGHATEALGWLDAIPDERERARLELEFNGIMTPALMSTRGWADAAVKAQVERSQALIDVLGDGPHVAPPLWALVNYHHLRGNQQQARVLAERAVAMEGMAQDAEQLSLMLPLLGACLLSQGWFVEARDCTARALALSGVPMPHPAVHKYGMEPRIYAMLVQGLALWNLGLPDEASKVMETALGMARELNHPGTLALAFIFTLVMCQLREDHPRFTALSGQAVELTTRQRLASQGTYSQILHGWATQDVARMDRGLALLDAQGSALYWPLYASMAAELEAELGKHDAAIARLEECIRRAQDVGEGFSLLLSLLRQGHCQLAKDPESPKGEARLWEALTLARERSAKLPELRAALALCRILLRRGQREEARELLVPLYGSFTEGFDTPDLVRARELLAELGA